MHMSIPSSKSTHKVVSMHMPMYMPMNMSAHMSLRSYSIPLVPLPTIFDGPMTAGNWPNTPQARTMRSPGHEATITTRT